ncbi:conserved hypothetical protein [Ricinus communis]|uniref:Uncharacterized protein n=1 Tax=Ricinus communis TaxID=3988 RepID=B9TF94_RICCO|nr:conserved hypothetical protein [Ricinus communis]
MVELRSTDNTYQLAHIVGNHNDNCAAPVADAGAKNYILEDGAGKVINNFGWSVRSTATQWGVNTPTGQNLFGADPSGNCFMGAAAGANHVINKAGTVQGGVILTVQGAGGTVLYVQHATAGTLNGAASAITMGMNSGNGRSINCAGTLNTGGADYAEYMRKAAGVGAIAKGQIVGITANDEITDRWADALRCVIKSTDPSYVGGDIWAIHLGSRPEQPVYVEPDYMGVTAGRAPVEPESSGEEERDAQAADAYTKALADWAATRAQEQAERAAYAAQIEQARADYISAMEAWQAANAKYDIDYESARATVDRIAFAGRVPVNVYGAQPGQYIVPVQDGDGIKGIAMNGADMSMSDYMRAVGQVTAIEPDGRARVVVKVA